MKFNNLILKDYVYRSFHLLFMKYINLVQAVCVCQQCTLLYHYNLFPKFKSTSSFLSNWTISISHFWPFYLFDSVTKHSCFTKTEEIFLEGEKPLKYERGGNLCNDAAVNFLRSDKLGAKCTQLCQTAFSDIID